MQNLARKHIAFNGLPVRQAAREREFHALSFAERKLAVEFGVDPQAACLLAMQAYGSGGRRR